MRAGIENMQNYIYRCSLLAFNYFCQQSWHMPHMLQSGSLFDLARVELVEDLGLFTAVCSCCCCCCRGCLPRCSIRVQYICLGLILRRKGGSCLRCRETVESRPVNKLTLQGVCRRCYFCLSLDCERGIITKQVARSICSVNYIWNNGCMDYSRIPNGGH